MCFAPHIPESIAYLPGAIDLQWTKVGHNSMRFRVYVFLLSFFPVVLFSQETTYHRSIVVPHGGQASLNVFYCHPRHKTYPWILMNSAVQYVHGRPCRNLVMCSYRMFGLLLGCVTLHCTFFSCVIMFHSNCEKKRLKGRHVAWQLRKG